MFLFCQELTFLVFIEPGDRLNVDVELLKGSDAFSEDFFNSWDSKEEERMGDHADIYIFELKDIFKVMLFISSDIGNESSLSLFDVISVTCHNLIQLLS